MTRKRAKNSEHRTLVQIAYKETSHPRISDLCRQLESYLEPVQVAEVYRAYLISAEAHEGQLRKSGEPYITHPLAVAAILAQMHMDASSIIAAILHDVLEDTSITKEQIVAEFGEEVGELVDGVSKLEQVHFENAQEAQAANFRKMILAMVRDIRVIMIKLADRLHNMGTLDVMRPDKRRRIARETLEIYSPIANRLGMNTLRIKLEELGFKAHYPLRYRVLKEAVKKSRGNRREIVQKIEERIKARLDQEGMKAVVIGREKNVFSLYSKMREKHLSFNEIMDVFAFRIIVDSVDSCYRTLGMMHNLYKPVPGKFKDYIAIPKSNGYQSLHVVLFGPYGSPIEVQIRTEEMDCIAEEGIAAHWLYKTGGADSSAQMRAQEWLRQLLEVQKSAGDSMEFLESVKVDLFPDEVYVFTPKGDIKVMPRGSTAVDFAYAVHSDVGNSCVACRMDRKFAPLSSRLQNGQTVEIITVQGAQPNPVWLDFVQTGKASSAIRHALKNLKYSEAVGFGERLLNKSLSAYGVGFDEVSAERIAIVLSDLHLGCLNDLLVEIGLGRQLPLVVAQRLASESVHGGQDGGSGKAISLKGSEGMVVSYARCCRPIPGDRILGYISSGRGIVVHKQSCKNIEELLGKPEKWLDVQWDEAVNGEFPVEIKLDVANKRGVLAVVAAVIAAEGVNIENVGLEEKDGLFTAMRFTILVQNRVHLARIMRRVRLLPDVARITRGRN